MLRFAALSMAGAVCMTGAALLIMMYAEAHPVAPLRQAQSVVATPSPAAETASEPDATGGTGAEVVKSPDGHYWAEAMVDGERVRFLVDTGATAVALTAQDAERLGFDPASLNYTATVMTAGGPARAAQVRLASVSVGGARVDDVPAMVIEKGLPASLLGMSYLGRLSQFEATRTALILRP